MGHSPIFFSIPNNKIRKGSMVWFFPRPDSWAMARFFFGNKGDKVSVVGLSVAPGLITFIARRNLVGLAQFRPSLH
jgi:hypothetical protein